MKSWIDLFIEYTEESEAPERYFWWSGAAVISAVTRKNTYIRRGTSYKLYPNIYVALVSARSGLGKGIPISKAKNLLESLDRVRVISGCNSIQGLIKDLSYQRTFKSGAVVSEAHGILLSDEFASFLIDDTKALTDLTALQNTHEHENGWIKTLRNSQPETLKSPCISLLIASNETLFETMVKHKDIEGGFIARTFIIYENQRRKQNDLIYNPIEMEKLKERSEKYKEELTARLAEIYNVQGEFTWSEDAIKIYRDWATKIFNMNHEDRTGSMDRIRDQVIKLAMIIALSSHHMDLTLRELDIYKAITETELCMAGVNRIAMEKEITDVNPIIARILKALIKAPDQELTRSKLMIQTHIEALILDRALETLQQREAIFPPKRNAKKEIFYKMKPDVYSDYVNFKKEEN